MWELYAFWIWIPRFLEEAYSQSNSAGNAILYVSLGTFLIFISGALGNMAGGKISDSIGRTKFNIIMLSISGISSLIIGFFLNNLIFALLIAILWGLTIVPDSPQYSAMISELSDPAYIGTTLAIQTSLGFALTNISIWLLPILVNLVGWQFGFIFLVIGPLFGIFSLIQLRKEDDSIKIAQGRK